MGEKSLLLCFLTCLLTFFVQIECWKNHAMKLSCWPDLIQFERFPVNIYVSTRRVKNVLFKYDGLQPDVYDFDPRRRTAVFVHGFHGRTDDYLVQRLQTELLKWQDMNVILIDWSVGSTKFVLYHLAARNTEYVALTIQGLFNQTITNWKNANRSLDEWGPVHFIGHSIGAHAVGQAAELLRKQGFLVDRVTGLDPAEPCFDTADNPLRLASTNAKFVDVIHTDAALMTNAAFGLRDPIGHADFYVNGGSKQPGCNVKRKLNASPDNTSLGYMYYTRLLLHSAEGGGCYHVRAFYYFIESIIQTGLKNCKFWSHPWNLDSTPEDTQRTLQTPCTKENCVEMGINAEFYGYNGNEQFYVPTTGAAPYCNV